MKKLFPAIAMLLMLTLTVGPVLAANCATSCAWLATEVGIVAEASSITSAEASMTAVSASAMAMDHCQQASAQQTEQQPPSYTPSKADPHTPQTEHKNCNMAGCHFAPLMPYLGTGHPVFIDNASVILFRSDVIAVSAEQSPPIKPPA